MKEPFLAIACIVALILCEDFATLKKFFLLPITITFVFGFLILFLTQLLKPYMSIYLPFMLGKHVSALGNPLYRGWDYNRLFMDLNAFSLPLGTLIFGIGGLYFILDLLKAKEKHKAVSLGYVFLHIFKFSLVIFLPTFSIGLGGQYFNHHFTFAIPVYLSLFIYVYQNILTLPDFYKKVIISILSLFIGLSALLLPSLPYQQRITNLKQETSVLKREAAYVDQILDTMGLERYMFLGRNGPQLYTYTKHSPLGPLFFQYPEWVEGNYQGFRDKLLDNLYTANIIVFDAFHVGKIETYLANYINEHFTQAPWPQVNEITRVDRRYLIFFRKIED
jgi:hypothetical protein